MGIRRTALAFTAMAVLTVAACGSGGGAGASPTPTPGGGGGNAGPATAATTPGASVDPGASGAASGSTGAKQIPDDACSIVSDVDIKGLFGGEVELVPNDDDDVNACSFSVTKANGLLQDYAATTPQIVSVTFDDGYISYADEHEAMGSAVDKVEGLGSEAWLGLGAIHVDLGDDNELVVTTVFGAIYDPTVITGERFALAKLVLSRL